MNWAKSKREHNTGTSLISRPCTLISGFLKYWKGSKRHVDHSQESLVVQGPHTRNYRKRWSLPDHSSSDWRCKCRTERQNLRRCILPTVWSLYPLVKVNRCGLEHRGYFVRPGPWASCPLGQESFLQGFSKVTLEVAKERLIGARVKHTGERSCHGPCRYITNYLRVVLHIFSLGGIQDKSKNGFGFNK